MENESAPLVFLAAHAYPAPVDPHYLQADIQSQPCGLFAFKAISLDYGGVLEERGNILFGYSYSAIPDTQADMIILGIPRAKFDLPSLGGKFDGISQQVKDNLLKEGDIQQGLHCVVGKIETYFQILFRDSGFFRIHTASHHLPQVV